MRALLSVLVGALVIVVIYVVVYTPIARISGGGPLLVMALAYAAGILVARRIWSGIKDNLAVWLIFLAVVLTVTYTYIPHYPPPPGASRGAANVEPPPGYVQQPPPEGSPWQFLALPIADPGGFAFLLFWVIVFGAYLTIVWGAKRMLITFAIALVSITLFVLARSLR